MIRFDWRVLALLSGIWLASVAWAFYGVSHSTFPPERPDLRAWHHHARCR